MRAMPASQPVALSSRVSAITWRSYCSHSQRLEALVGAADHLQPRGVPVGWGGDLPQVEVRVQRRAGPRDGRSSGASSNSRASGTSQTVSPSMLEHQAAGVGGVADDGGVQAPLRRWRGLHARGRA